MPGQVYDGPSGLNPDIVTDGTSQPTEQAMPQERFGAQDPPGPWLDEPDEAKVAKAILKAWTDQDSLYTNEIGEVRVNDLRRKGYHNVEAVKSQDKDEITIWNWGRAAPGLNKAAALCRKFPAALLADPPEPDPEPAGTDAIHRDQADFSRRVLQHLLAEGELDMVSALWEAEDLASTYRRAYICLWVEPRGERTPLQVEAHPQATSALQPFAGPPDPMTGQPTPLDPGAAILRFVREDGSLTDQQGEAAWTWAPKLRREVVDGRHVRYLPASAETLADAHGVLIASFQPLGRLKRFFPDTDWGSERDTEKLTQYPSKARCLLPGETRREREALSGLKGDDRLVFTIRGYIQACGEYSQGFYGVTAGQDRLLWRKPWAAEMPKSGQEPLDIPLAELRQFRHECVMDIVGEANELRAQQLSAILDHTDQVLNRKLLIPLSSTVTDSDLDSDRRVLVYNPPSPPVWERVDPLDQGVVQTFEMLKAEAQEDLGLGATAENLTGPSSGQSGRAKFAVIGQAQVALSEPRHWLLRAYTRLCRVVLQQVRAFYTVPQRMRWVSPDGAYKERRWTGADLGGTRDVRLKAGSLSLMTPPMKTEQVIALVQAGVPIPPDEILNIVVGNTEALSTLREEPFRTRVRRQIAEWSDGPPEGWQPPPPMIVGVDPMTGQPLTQPSPDPVLARTWEPVPADVLPTVAQVRTVELGKAQASETYARWPAEWRLGLDQEFERMRQAAGIQTVAEQQAAAQAAALAAQQQAVATGKPAKSQEQQNQASDAKAQQSATQEVVQASGVG